MTQTQTLTKPKEKLLPSLVTPAAFSQQDTTEKVGVHKNVAAVTRKLTKERETNHYRKEKIRSHLDQKRRMDLSTMGTCSTRSWLRRRRLDDIGREEPLSQSFREVNARAKKHNSVFETESTIGTYPPDSLKHPDMKKLKNRTPTNHNWQDV